MPSSTVKTEPFNVIDSDLIRIATASRGTERPRRCTRATFRSFLQAILDLQSENWWLEDDAKAAGFTISEIAAHAKLPRDEIAVAAAFLVDRGCLAARRGHYYPSSRIFYRDAMTAYLALAENEGA